MSSFPDANAAVQAAQVMQQTITEDSSPDHFPLAIREGVQLHREELLVQGTETISLGRALSAEAPESIHFLCES